MPAKTVEDIAKVNELLQGKDKVFVKIDAGFMGGTYLSVQFCDSKGREIDQASRIRKEYYGLQTLSKAVEKGTEAGIERYTEPESDKPLFPWGNLDCYKNLKKEEYHCHGAWMIGSSLVAKGYGPMLYDVALEVLGKSGIGLTADRKQVSSPAAKVWLTYLQSRSNVKSKPFDLNHSTPETDDDCWSEHSSDTTWNQWIAKPEDPEEKKEAEKKFSDAINRIYFDAGINTVEALQQAGLIYGNNIPTIPAEPAENITENIFRLYNSFLIETYKRNT